MPRLISVRIGRRGRTDTAILSSVGALGLTGNPKLIGLAGLSGVGLLSTGFAEPTAANTGLNRTGLTTTDLTVVNGDLTIDDTYVSNNGTTIDKLWIKGHLLFTATQAVTLTNSYIQGRTFATAGSPPYEVIVRARRTTSPVTAVLNLLNCVVTCIQPDVGLSGLAGERLGYLHYCDISLGSDGADYWNPAVIKALGSYFHDYTFWANDPKHTTDSQHPGWCHPDMIQNSGNGGGPGYVIGCSFDIRAHPTYGDVETLKAGGFPSRNYGCGVMMTPSGGHIQNMDIHDNWFRYGEVQVCMPQQNGSFDNTNSMQVYNNKHNYPHGYGPYSGNYSMQFIRWGYPEGPLPADVYNNMLLNDANVPAAKQGTLLPIAANTGGTGSTGQWMVSINDPSQIETLGYGVTAYGTGPYGS